jgi:hypothetical protein
MLTGSAIANVVVGPQILPVTAHVALGITAKVAAIAADVEPVTSHVVAAQILPVGVKISPVSLEILLISANIGAVASDVAFVVGAIAWVGTAVVVTRLLLVRSPLVHSGALRRDGSRSALALRLGPSCRGASVVVTAQILPIRMKVGLISPKVVLISTNVGLVAGDGAYSLADDLYQFDLPSRVQSSPLRYGMH